MGPKIVPPQINQNAKNGYTTVNKNNFFDTVLNSTGAMATHNKTAAKFGRQNSEGGYLKPYISCGQRSFNTAKQAPVAPSNIS
jgi:hypothetical protein